MRLPLFLLLTQLLIIDLATAQGKAVVKVFPPTCGDCLNGRMILLDIEDCGVPDLNYTWLVDEASVISRDSVQGLGGGYHSLIIVDASAWIDTVQFYLGVGLDIEEQIGYWSCFDSTDYRPDVEFNAVVVHADRRDTLAGSEVFIYQDDKLFTRIITPEGDGFSTLLPLDHDYDLEFTHEGFFTKRLTIDTRGVNPWKVGAGYSMELSVSMIEKEEGLFLDILDDPIGTCQYNADTNLFEWDYMYTKRIKDALDIKLQEFREE